MTTLVHHMAALDDSPHPPNTLEAIRACLAAGARVIEIDITPLASADFLLVHDPVLEHETTGQGPVRGANPADVAHLHIRARDGAVQTAYRPPLLRQVVELLTAEGGPARLQIDYKDVYPSDDDEPLRRLVRLIEPLGPRVIVSTGADWHLRRLRALAPWLDLGFDIGLYLDWRPESWPDDPRVPPYQRGAYGYHDDHLLARTALLRTANYLAERCAILAGMCENISTWYVSHHCIAHMLDDDFNLAHWLARRGMALDAWTLDSTNPTAMINATRLRDAGVSLFTSNTPRALAAHLDGD
jgi:glycerophosphoryl diester phosphodiesterase